MRILWGGTIVESIEVSGIETGSAWRVRIIRAGRSENGNEYPLAVLHESAHLFEGASVLLRTEDEHIRNSNVSAENTVGWLQDVTPVAEGLDATLVFTEDTRARELGTKLSGAFQKGKTDLLGLSIVADAIAHRRRTGGKVSRVVEKIVRVYSVDVIVNPAAGGQFLHIAASESEAAAKREEGYAMNLEKLLKLIETHDPEGYKTLDLSKIDESLVASLAAKVVESLAEKTAGLETKLAEAVKPAAGNEGGGGDEGLTAIRESLKTVTDALKELRESQSSDGQALRELRKMRFDTLFDELCTESRLPDDAREHAMSRIAADDRDPEKREKIAEAIEAERKYYFKRSGYQGTPSIFSEAEVTADAGDKFVAALTGMFTGRDMPHDAKTPKETTPRATSLREAYIQFTGDVNVTGLERNAPNVPMLYESAQTLNAQWGYVLGDSVTRAMLAAYRLPALMEWENIVSKERVNDFRTQHRTQIGGFPGLSTVTAGSDYAGFTDVPDDFEATYAVSKKGNTQAITLEMISNDDVGAVKRIPLGIARAAKLTISSAVWTLVTGNGAIYDTDTLFHAANHGNTGTFAAMALASIIAGRTAMKKQTLPAGVDSTAGERLLLDPSFLCASVDLEQTMFELCMSLGKPSLDKSTAATTDAEGIPNFVNQLGIKPLTIPHLTDANDWFLIANPVDCPTIEVGFLNGNEEPEIFVQDMPNVGSMFTADKLTYKIRHIYGAVVSDYRGFYGMLN